MANNLSLKEIFDYTSKGLMGLLVFMGAQIWQDTSKIPLIELRLQKLEQWQVETSNFMREGRDNRKATEAELAKDIAILGNRVERLDSELDKLRKVNL